MKKTCLLFFCLNAFVFFSIHAEQKKAQHGLVISTKKIELDDFPEAFNPSLIKIESGFLLTFRHCLTPHFPWISYIGIVKLDDDLNVISTPQLLNTREEGSFNPSQSEDARIFTFNKKIYLIYNDNLEAANGERRDMFLAELEYIDDEFFLSPPLKLVHETKYDTVMWQKNWVPFEYRNQLLMSYSISSHEVLRTDLISGVSKTVCNKRSGMTWDKGVLRGGTPALLVDGSYLAFFHSSIVTKSNSSNGHSMHHYFMGAYTFSAEPPFKIEKISPSPIIGDGFYTQSSYDKRVIFPGGFAIAKNQFYVAYGKDDSEIWIATINKKKLMSSLKSTK